MVIYVRNKSTVLSDGEIRSWMPAFNQYLGNVRQWWPRPSSLKFAEPSSEDAWQLVFADTSDTAGALGYHDYTPTGKPISYVFAKDDLEYGYNPTVTATHEIAEMIADPWISQVFQVANDEFYAQEIADPCEADKYAYDVRGVKCSDFVLPMWFVPGSRGKYDYMGHIKKPLQLLPGGYMSVYRPGQQWTQIYAQSKDFGQSTAGTVRQVPLGAKNKNGFSRAERYARKR